MKNWLIKKLGGYTEREFNLWYSVYYVKRKLAKSKGGTDEMHDCPNCQVCLVKILGGVYLHHCPCCGQKLKWEGAQ